jgi:hypothetical protein
MYFYLFCYFIDLQRWSRFFVIESLEVDRKISSTLENQIFIQVISFIFSAM